MLLVRSDFLVRNFLLALLTVVFANHAHRQIHVFVIILLFSGFPLAMLSPYRWFAPNVVEAVVASCLTMLLLGAGMLLGAENKREVVINDLQILFGVFIGVGWLAFVVVGCRQVHLRVFPAPRYLPSSVLIRTACAVGARVMKLELGKRCFLLDSDNLDSLDVLLDIVRTTNHVVLLARDTLWRPWCAADLPRSR